VQNADRKVRVLHVYGYKKDLVILSDRSAAQGVEGPASAFALVFALAFAPAFALAFAFPPQKNLSS
jgi:hypothetical protein